MPACFGCPHADGMVHDASKQAVALPLKGFITIREEETS
jgi:hypothetical protein